MCFSFLHNRPMIGKRIYFLFYTYLISISLVQGQNDITPVINDLNERSKTQTFEKFNETNKTLNTNDERVKNQISLLNAKYYIKSKSLAKASEALNFFLQNNVPLTDSLRISQQALAYELQAHLFFRQKAADSSTHYFNKSSLVYLKCNDQKKAFYTLNMSATISYLNGNYFAGLKTAYDALELAEKYPIEESMIADLEIDIGNIFMRLEQYEKTDSLLTLTLENRKAYLTTSQLADIHNNLGLCSFRIGNTDDAKYHFIEAESNYKLIKKTTGLSKVYNNLASLYTELQKDEEKAIDYYQKAIALKNRNSDSAGLSNSYYNIASLFFNINNSDSSFYYARLAESYSVYEDDNLSETYYLLSKLYYNKQNLASAYVYADKRGSLLKRIIETRFIDAQKLTTEKHSVYLQNKEIELLEKNKELDRLRLNRNNIMLVFIGISFLFLLLGFIRYMRSVKKQQITDKELFERRLSLKSLSSLLKGQEKERKRIAEDLHDGVGSTLTLLSLKANEIKNKDIIRLTSQVSKEVREISKNILPDVIMKLGLQEALIDLSEQFAKSNVILDFVFKSENEMYNEPQKKLMLYRVLQELTKNAVNHGKANYISVHCEQHKNCMDIYFEDNGSGFKYTEESRGIGLDNIRNRVIFLDGTISFKSSDRGTLCHINLPMND